MGLSFPRGNIEWGVDYFSPDWHSWPLCRWLWRVTLWQAKLPVGRSIVMKSAWGSDDLTKAAFPFLHGLALAKAGHQVQFFLLGEAVGLMRKVLANRLHR